MLLRWFWPVLGKWRWYLGFAEWEDWKRSRASTTLHGAQTFVHQVPGCTCHLWGSVYSIQTPTLCPSLDGCESRYVEDLESLPRRYLAPSSIKLLWAEFNQECSWLVARVLLLVKCSYINMQLDRCISMQLDSGKVWTLLSSLSEVEEHTGLFDSYITCEVWQLHSTQGRLRESTGTLLRVTVWAKTLHVAVRQQFNIIICCIMHRTGLSIVHHTSQGMQEKFEVLSEYRAHLDLIRSDRRLEEKLQAVWGLCTYNLADFLGQTHPSVYVLLYVVCHEERIE